MHVLGDYPLFVVVLANVQSCLHCKQIMLLLKHHFTTSCQCIENDIHLLLGKVENIVQYSILC